MAWWDTLPAALGVRSPVLPTISIAEAHESKKKRRGVGKGSVTRGSQVFGNDLDES